MRILQLFEHQHGALRESQLAGQEQAYWAGPRDDHVVDQGVLSAQVLVRAYASVSIAVRSVQGCIFMTRSLRPRE